MTYLEAVDVLFTKLPMFQRSGPAAYKANLDGTRAVCKLLDHPEKDLKFIHVAGTNGKGSVSHMVAAVLQKAGYKTGLFTSPHLVDFRERIRLNGEKIPEFKVVHFVENYSDSWGEPSFFELTFGMALQYFKEENADIVILETGMGGRLDSTNAIPTAVVCAITNIGLDHTQFLGEDISSIAIEKAGIIKNEVPVVLGKMRPEAQSEILKAALRASSEMHYGRIVPESLIDLMDSPFAFENIATAVKIIDVLRDRGWIIAKKSEREGFQNYKELTGQLGRWQTIPPAENLSEILVDCAHNTDGMRMLFHSLSQQHPDTQFHIVFGTVADKNPCNVLELIPKNSIMYWCTANVVRSMGAECLQNHGLESGLSGEVYSSVSEAFTAARTAVYSLNLELDQKARAVVCGSVYVVGELFEFTKS
jgi:dihydrofolate synthase/folylpolyglutamate synthase